jgi:aminoglycoside 3-N-acetyltransferase
LDELIANFNNLTTFFSSSFAKAIRLYPERRFPRKPAVLVHVALSSLGKVDGGAATVLAALTAVCAEQKMTLVMPAHTDIPEAPRDGENWSGALPEPVLFDRHASSCRGMGILAETFRTQPLVYRSAHPYLSFCARGPQARRIIRSHTCRSSLGPRSPLGRMYHMDALVLLLGTGYETCTALHLAEYKREQQATRKKGERDRVTCQAFIQGRFGPVGKQWTDITFHPETFPDFGLAFEQTHPEKCIKLLLPFGKKDRARYLVLFRMQELIDFSVRLDRHRLFG